MKEYEQTLRAVQCASLPGWQTKNDVPAGDYLSDKWNPSAATAAKQKSDAVVSIIVKLGFAPGALCNAGQCPAGTCLPTNLRSLTQDDLELEILTDSSGKKLYAGIVKAPGTVSVGTDGCGCL